MGTPHNEILKTEHPFIGEIVQVGDSKKPAKITGVFLLDAGYGPYIKRVRIEWCDSKRSQVVKKKSLKIVKRTHPLIGKIVQRKKSNIDAIITAVFCKMDGYVLEVEVQWPASGRTEVIKKRDIKQLLDED